MMIVTWVLSLNRFHSQNHFVFLTVWDVFILISPGWYWLLWLARLFFCFVRLFLWQFLTPAQCPTLAPLASTAWPESANHQNIDINHGMVDRDNLFITFVYLFWNNRVLEQNSRNVGYVMCVACLDFH